MAAVRATNHSNSAKMGLAMKRRFWEEDDQIFGGHLYSNLPHRRVLVSLDRVLFPKRACCWACTRTVAVADLIDKPVADRIEHVLMHSSKVHPQIRQEFESAYGVWWKKVEYSRGGYASGAAGPTRAVVEGGQPAADRVRCNRAVF